MQGNNVAEVGTYKSAVLDIQRADGRRLICSHEYLVNGTLIMNLACHKVCIKLSCAGDVS